MNNSSKFATFVAAVATSASFLFVSDAQAATLNVSGDASYSDVIDRNPGVYGAELRGGVDGAGDWEIGVGSHTSVGGQFAQNEFSWDANLTPVSFVYDYGLASANAATLTLGEGNSAVVTSFDFGTLEFGNTIRLFAKRNAEINIDAITAGGDTEAVAFSATGNPSNAWDPLATVLLFNEDFETGFRLEGTLFVEGGGRSTHEIFIAAGNIAPVPLPAAAWMLMAGLGGLVVAGRRKRKSA